MIRKAVIPAAGFGTRLLPATKAVPKELLPIVDAPTIQYVVEEAVASGIRDILIIVSEGKEAIVQHFDRDPALEALLIEKGKAQELEILRHIDGLANIQFAWQEHLDGLGGAIRCAQHFVEDEPFAVLLGDCLLTAKRPVTRQLMELHERYKASVVALEEVSRDKVERYGVIDGREVEKDVFEIRRLVEKPSAAEAPSNLVVAGRYILTPEIFGPLAAVGRGKNNEVQLTDALARLLPDRPIVGLKFEGRRWDVGDKMDFLKTNLAFALQRPDMGPALRAYLRELLGPPG